MVLSQKRTEGEDSVNKKPDYKGFALDILHGWPDVGNFDGFDIEELALKHKLLEPIEVNQPCAEECACAEYYSTEEFKEGITCNRMVEE